MQFLAPSAPLKLGGKILTSREQLVPSILKARAFVDDLQSLFSAPT